MNTTSKKILYLKTSHVIPFKTLTEVLSNVILVPGEFKDTLPLFKSENKIEKIDKDAIEYYKSLSNQLISKATPIMINSGTSVSSPSG